MSKNIRRTLNFSKNIDEPISIVVNEYNRIDRTSLVEELICYAVEKYSNRDFENMTDKEKAETIKELFVSRAFKMEVT